MIEQEQSVSHVLQSLPPSIRVTDILTTFIGLQAHIDVLSLDCFDTLLWRKSAYPKDIFYDLQQFPICQKLGVTAMQRVAAEDEARRLKATVTGIFEVHLEEIYRTGFPSLPETDIQQLVAAEIAAEMAACYAYPAVCELIQYAHQAGKKIIIVSNTYLSAGQLKQLLQHCLPHDIYALIDEVFCSSDAARSKSDGLYQQVLTRLQTAPARIMHLGDNYALDGVIPRKLGIIGVHLAQFDRSTIDWARLYSLAALITNPLIHHQHSLTHLFRGLFAAQTIEKPETIIGYMSFGPMMYAFSHFLKEEIRAFAQQHTNIKVLFLMRDAYLPYHAYEALFAETPGQCVRISRFTALGASFRTAKNVVDYLAANGFASRFQEVSEQLSLPKEIAERLIAMAMASHEPVHTFNKLILQPDILQIIFAKSSALRAKLIHHLHNEANITAGDAVMLVDIGYIGRIQRVLTPLLLDEMGVKTVTGRYFISMNIPEWQQSRRGLIDPSWCDDRVMDMLSNNLAMFEEICCSGDQSIIGYDDNGAAIFSSSYVSDEQRALVRAAQAECLRFMQEAEHFLQRSHIQPSLSMLRETALYELIRREYFPLPHEIYYFNHFRHDNNVGGYAYFDSPESDAENLRKQGLRFVDQHAYGLRAIHLGLGLTVMAQRRFGFEINLQDLSLRQDELMTVSIINQKIVKRRFPAVPTHDGYFALWFPLEPGTTQIALLFGMNYQYFQLDSAEMIVQQQFFQKYENISSRSVLNTLLINHLQNKGKNLYECLSKEGAVIFSPPGEIDQPQIFRISFRPII